ncbi:hypothetical protein LINPERHAP1_LOCUS20117 [Linum perenne]
MIYRKWSLLTGPTAIIGGIVGATIVANYLFIQNDWLVKRDGKKNPASSSSSK